MWSCFPCRLVAKNVGLHAVRSGRVCGLVRWLSSAAHSNEPQGDPPNKIGVFGCARSVVVVVFCFTAVSVLRALEKKLNLAKDEVEEIKEERDSDEKEEALKDAKRRRTDARKDLQRFLDLTKEAQEA